MSNTLIILNDPPYGTERSYNGLRLAAWLSRRDGVEVRVFLMGDAAACAKRGQTVIVSQASLTHFYVNIAHVDPMDSTERRRS